MVNYLNKRSGIFLGGQRGHFARLKMVLPPELCLKWLNDKLILRIIKFID